MSVFVTVCFHKKCFSFQDCSPNSQPARKDIAAVFRTLGVELKFESYPLECDVKKQRFIQQNHSEHGALFANGQRMGCNCNITNNAGSSEHQHHCVEGLVSGQLVAATATWLSRESHLSGLPISLWLRLHVLFGGGGEILNSDK